MPNPKVPEHTCAVEQVTIRVAGQVTTEAFANHFGTTSQQVGVRAGDVLTYVHTAEVAAKIAEVHESAFRLAALELPEAVGPGCLGLAPGTYPPGVLVRFRDVPHLGVTIIPRAGAARPRPTCSCGWARSSGRSAISAQRGPCARCGPVAPACSPGERRCRGADPQDRHPRRAVHTQRRRATTPRRGGRTLRG